MYGVAFDQHDDRYARTAEWLDVVNGLWKQPRFTLRAIYKVATRFSNRSLAPRPTIYAGGESEAAKNLIAEMRRLCDARRSAGRVAAKIADMHPAGEASGCRR